MGLDASLLGQDDIIGLMKANVLYVSYDGLLDPLGQSQILPYLTALQEIGHRITILSFEKPARWSAGGGEMQRRLDQQGIRWVPKRFTARPPLASKAWDLWKIRRSVSVLWSGGKFDFIHCRGHIPVLAALPISDARYLFDVRGFWFDERIDSGLWDQRKWIYRSIYRHFKRGEPEMYTRANRLVTLTERARNILTSRFPELAAPGRIATIPCCVDTAHFSRASIIPDAAEAMRRELGLDGAGPVVAYLGSLGTWYMLEEMLRFFALIRQNAPQAKLLLISPDDSRDIKRLAGKLGIPQEAVIRRELPRTAVPTALSLADFGLFFILPSPSKQSSSPTKLAEMLSMGLPVVCNAGVGDLDAIFQDTSLGHLVERLDEGGLRHALDDIPRLLGLDRCRIAEYALARFSLQMGVEVYDKIYSEMHLDACAAA